MVLELMSGSKADGVASRRNWVLVKGFNLGYYNQESMSFTVDLYYGNLN